jgi:hypothetical protein
MPCRHCFVTLNAVKGLAFSVLKFQILRYARNDKPPFGWLT